MVSDNERLPPPLPHRRSVPDLLCSDVPRARTPLRRQTTALEIGIPRPAGGEGVSRIPLRRRTIAEEVGVAESVGGNGEKLRIPLRRQTTALDFAGGQFRRLGVDDGQIGPFRRLSTSSKERSQSQCLQSQRSIGTAARCAGDKKVKQRWPSLQVEAVEALMKHIVWDCPLEEMAKCMLGQVVDFDCSPAFTEAQISSAIETVRGAPGDPHATVQHVDSEDAGVLKQQKVSQLMDVFRTLALSSDMQFSDVLGQVLWQYRTAKVLRTAKFRLAVEDLGWVDAGTAKFDSKTEVSKLVADVYRILTANSEGGMRHAIWFKVVRLLEVNPILQPRLRRSDADRLFYTHTHQNGEGCSGVSCAGFKRLLLDFAATMRVHPTIVFLAVGSHAEHLTLLATKTEG